VDRVLLIPAAGTGSRLGGGVPKLLAPVNGRPMIAHVIDLYRHHVDRIVLVVAPDALAQVRTALSAEPGVVLVVQETPSGMLDAILLARSGVAAGTPRRVLISWCDQVAIAPATAGAVIAAAAAQPEPSIVMPVCRSADPYVHLVRDAAGTIVEVLHKREGDGMPPEGESDAGVFDLSREAYLEWLPQYATAPQIGARTGERNFVPFVAWAAARGAVVTIPCRDREEAVGINTPEDRVRIEQYLRRRASQ
jgi:bifunctional N-acetylglucosamine-1-phosphate-uridyltransferase/glucosamine-1-phosphate-acetyltransferase GlmU-like protein